jgi:hypothetical protein
MEQDHDTNGTPADPVVKEIKLFISSELSKHLYLFQFPVRNRPYQGQCAPISLRSKPKAGIFELDLPLDPQAPNYNKDRGEELALGLNEEAKVKTVYDAHDNSKGELMDRFTLRSSKIPKATTYMIGVMRSGECSSENDQACFG